MSDPTQADQSTPVQPATPAAASSGASQSTPPTGTAAAPVQAAPASPAVKPDWVPDQFWDATKGEAKSDDLKKFWSERDAARAAIPVKPEDYKLDLAGATLPEGYEPDPKEAEFVGLQKIAHEEGLSQATVNKLVKLRAATLTASADNLKQAIAARDKALGENGTARVKALAEFIDSHWTDQNEAKQVKATMWTPVIVKFIENYQKMLSTQGTHSFTQTGREGGQDANDGRPAGWETASPENRRAWDLQQQREAARGRH